VQENCFILRHRVTREISNIFLGKGENIWDRLTHTHPEAIADGNNGDIATDQYHKIDEDIGLLKTIGVSADLNTKTTQQHYIA